MQAGGSASEWGSSPGQYGAHRLGTGTAARRGCLGRFSEISFTSKFLFYKTFFQKVTKTEK